MSWFFAFLIWPINPMETGVGTREGLGQLPAELNSATMFPLWLSASAQFWNRGWCFDLCDVGSRCLDLRPPVRRSSRSPAGSATEEKARFGDVSKVARELGSTVPSAPQLILFRLNGHFC